MTEGDELEWVVTIEVEPKIAFLWAAVKAFFQGKALRIRRTYTSNPLINNSVMPPEAPIHIQQLTPTLH